MSKIYLVVKYFYGDFDVQKEEVLSASTDELRVDEAVAKLNAKRSSDDIKNEVSFEKQTVKRLI